MNYDIPDAYYEMYIDGTFICTYARRNLCLHRPSAFREGDRRSFLTLEKTSATYEAMILIADWMTGEYKTKTIEIYDISSGSMFKIEEAVPLKFTREHDPSRPGKIWIKELMFQVGKDFDAMLVIGQETVEYAWTGRT